MIFTGTDGRRRARRAAMGRTGERVAAAAALGALALAGQAAAQTGTDGWSRPVDLMQPRASVVTDADLNSRATRPSPSTTAPRRGGAWTGRAPAAGGPGDWARPGHRRPNGERGPDGGGGRRRRGVAVWTTTANEVLASRRAPGRGWSGPESSACVGRPPPRRWDRDLPDRPARGRRRVRGGPRVHDAGAIQPGPLLLGACAAARAGGDQLEPDPRARGGAGLHPAGGAERRGSRGGRVDPRTPRARTVSSGAG